MGSLICLPWPLRRWALNAFCGYRIHPTARIGLSWILPRRLIMEEHTYIGHLTVAVNLELIHLHRHARIGKGNWITGFPLGHAEHFAHQPEAPVGVDYRYPLRRYQPPSHRLHGWGQNR